MAQMMDESPFALCLIASRTLLNGHRRLKIRILGTSGQLKEVGERLAQQSLSPALNDCPADPSRVALQGANPRPASPAYS
jgi:hypothetical protein